MEETAAAIALPDDAVREILARVVDHAALFRCATTTCKWWRVLVADPSFLRRRWPADSPRSSPIFGCIALQRHDSEPVFVPAPQSPLAIGGQRSLRSFFPEAARSILDGAEPLTARRGLLLVHLRGGDIDAIHLAVCDLLAGTCHVLPPLKWQYYLWYMRRSCFAIVTSADICSGGGQSPLPEGHSRTFFKVLIIADALSEDSSGTAWNRYDLHMFASNESSWAVHRECFNQRGTVYPCRQRSGVVRRGTAHWLFKIGSDFHILKVGAETGHVSFLKLSIPLNAYSIAPCLTIAIDGTLSLLRLSHDGNQVENWTCKDGDTTAAWICTRMIELERPKQTRATLTSIWVGERSGELFFVDSRIHIAELETGATEDVTAQFSGLDYVASVPFEVDWTTFFSSRLGLGGRN